MKIYIKKEDYLLLIDNTINKIMKEKKVCYDTACLVLYYSKLWNDFEFKIRG